MTATPQTKSLSSESLVGRVLQAATVATSIYPDVSTAPIDAFGASPLSRLTSDFSSPFVPYAALCTVRPSPANLMAQLQIACNTNSEINAGQTGQVFYYSYAYAPSGATIAACAREDGVWEQSAYCYLNPSSGDLDLSVTGISLTKLDGSAIQVDASGYPILPPNQQVQAVVTFGATGIQDGDTRSTTVSLYYGSEAIGSETVALSSLQSGSFSETVTFTPIGAGIQTLTATIDSDNALQETNLTNNTLTRNIDVQAGFKLVAMVNGAIIPDSGAKLVLPPSIKTCGALKSFSQPTSIAIQCLNPSTNQPVAGCLAKVNVQSVQNNGGHNHNINDLSHPRPLMLTTPDTNFPVDTNLLVAEGGLALVYTPPEVAGDVLAQIAGFDPNGKPIQGISYTFEVKTDLELVDLSNAGARTPNPGISIVTLSHPDAGVYGTKAMKTKVAQMVLKYYQYAKSAGIANPNPLASQGATLVWGGLFDANWNGAVYDNTTYTPWSPPHCGHRNGTTIDLSLSQLEPRERALLNRAAKYAGFKFHYLPESPNNPNADHWHATLN